MVTPGTLKRQNPSQYSSVGSGEGQGGYCVDIEKRKEAEIEIDYLVVAPQILDLPSPLQ